MAKKDEPRRPITLKEEDFVSHLVEDPSRLPDTRLLIGFLGNSGKEGYWRLYLSPELNEFLEFQEKDVLRSQPLADSQLGGTAIWIRREAELQHTRTTTREAQAQFLQGTIASAFRAGAIAGSFTGGAQALIGQIKSIPPQASVCFSCPSDLCPVPTSGGPTCEYGCTFVCTLTTRCKTEFLCLP